MFWKEPRPGTYILMCDSMDITPTSWTPTFWETVSTSLRAQWPASSTQRWLRSDQLYLRSSGHRSRSVHLVIQSRSECVESGLRQSEQALGSLMLITAIHHVGRSLPPHVCFDLFLSSTVTVKDEGACGRAGTVPQKPAAQAAAPGVPARRSRPQPRHRTPCQGLGRATSVGCGGGRRCGPCANCRTQRVTLGDGGIKACWLVFTGGAKVTFKFLQSGQFLEPHGGFFFLYGGGSGSY